MSREHDFGEDGFGACRGCGLYVEQLIDVRYCAGSPEAEAARASFAEDHSPATRRRGREGRSIPHSYGAEGRNWAGE